MELQKNVSHVFLQLSLSLGQHIRHIIEMFQCLETGYQSGEVDYEKRKRGVAPSTLKYRKQCVQ